MSRRDRKESQTEEEEEEEEEIKQEVKLEYDIPMPFNDATTSSASYIGDPKFVYLLHLDLSDLQEETKVILFENKISFKSLLKLNEATLEKVGIAFGERISLLAFIEKCKKNGNEYPPPPEPADDGFVMKLIRTFDISISQSSLDTLFKHLQFSYEFWNLSEEDLLGIFGRGEKEKALRIFNAQQYLLHEEHWSQLRMFVDRKSVESFLSEELSDEDVPLLDCYRVPELVSQLVKVTPKRPATVKLHCIILHNFAMSSLGQQLIGRQDVVDYLVASSQYVTSAEAVIWWSRAIRNIASIESNKKLFGCSSIRDALVTVSKYATASPVVYATTAEAVHWWSNAITKITFKNESNKELFGCESVVQAIIAVSKYAFTAEAVDSWSNAICSLTADNESNVKLFSCESVLDTFVAVSKYATTRQAVYWWVAAIDNINLMIPETPRVINAFYGGEFNEAFVDCYRDTEMCDQHFQEEANEEGVEYIPDRVLARLRILEKLVNLM